jgi:hypothetical protein
MSKQKEQKERKEIKEKNEPIQTSRLENPQNLQLSDNHEQNPCF